MKRYAHIIALSFTTVVCFACDELPHEAGGPLLRFGVITDVQYCDCPTEGDRDFRASLYGLRQAVGWMNTLYSQGEIAFTIHLGDLVDRDSASFGPILEEWSRLNHPAFLVPGNHDLGAFGVYERAVRALGIDSPTGRGYFSFSAERASGWRFIVLDGNDASLTAGRETQENVLGDSLYHVALEHNPETVWWNGGVSSRQLQWLEQQLDLATEAKEKVIVFCHFPLDGTQRLSLWNAEDVAHVLNRHDIVRGFFAGHDHRGLSFSRPGLPQIVVPSLLSKDGNGEYGVGLIYPDHIVFEGRRTRLAATGAR